MPEFYLVDKKAYDIPESEKEGFLKAFPKAVPALNLVVGKDRYVIPSTLKDEFFQKFPNAVGDIDLSPTAEPEKKKSIDISVPSGVEALLPSYQSRTFADTDVQKPPTKAQVRFDKKEAEFQQRREQGDEISFREWSKNRIERFMGVEEPSDKTVEGLAANTTTAILNAPLIPAEIAEHTKEMAKDVGWIQSLWSTGKGLVEFPNHWFNNALIYLSPLATPQQRQRVIDEVYDDPTLPVFAALMAKSSPKIPHKAKIKADQIVNTAKTALAVEKGIANKEVMRNMSPEVSHMVKVFKENPMEAQLIRDAVNRSPEVVSEVQSQIPIKDAPALPSPRPVLVGEPFTPSALIPVKKEISVPSTELPVVVSLKGQPTGIEPSVPKYKVEQVNKLQTEANALSTTIKVQEGQLKEGGLTETQARNIQNSINRASELETSLKNESIDKFGIELNAFTGIPTAKMIKDGVKGFKKLFNSTKPMTPEEVNRQYDLITGRRTTPNMPNESSKIPPDLSIAEQSKSVMLQAVREKKSNVAKAYRNASDWEERLSDRDLNDIGASVEKIGNLEVVGDSYVDVNRRMTKEKTDVLNEYRRVQEDARQSINNYLKDTGKDEYIKLIDNYLAHFYTAPKEKMTNARNRFLKNSPNARQRQIPNLEEAMKLGLTPITQNVSTLHRMWSEMNWRVATNRKFAFDLKSMVTGEGEPLVTKPKDAPDGYVHVNNNILNQIYAKKLSDGKTVLWDGGVMVHPDIKPVIDMMYGDIWNNKFYNALSTFNAVGKKMSLSFSLFHHGSLTESAQAVLARGKNPVRGLLVIGEIDPISGKRITAQRPHKIGMKLMRDAEFLKDAIEHGLTMEATSDAHVTKIAKQLMTLEARSKDPFSKAALKNVRKFNQWWDKNLWERYHSGLKAYSYYDVVEMSLKKYPHLDPKYVKETVASYLNDAYGGLEWESKLWATPQVQQALQLAILAPDWTLANFNIATKTATKVKNPVRRNLQLQYWRNMIPTLIGTAGIIQYGIHQAFGDEELGDQPFVWDNEVGKEWMDIDITPLMRQLPWHDPNDKQRYYTHFGKQAREVVGWVKDPMTTIFRKASPAVHVAFEQMFELQSPDFGTDFKDNEAWLRLPESAGIEAYQRAKSIAGKFVPFAWRGNNFAFTAPLSKGMTKWKAIRSLEHAYDLYADPKYISLSKQPNFIRDLSEIGSDIIDAAALNGVDVDKVITAANTGVRTKYYTRFFNALEAHDQKGMDKWAKSIIRLHGGISNIARSAKNRDIDINADMAKFITASFQKSFQELKE